MSGNLSEEVRATLSQQFPGTWNNEEVTIEFQFGCFCLSPSCRLTKG